MGGGSKIWIDEDSEDDDGEDRATELLSYTTNLENINTSVHFTRNFGHKGLSMKLFDSIHSVKRLKHILQEGDERGG